MDREYTIRKMKYQSSRRSTLELDQLLRRLVARINWDDFSDNDLIVLGEILDLDDLVLQKGLMFKTPAPEGADPGMWDRVLKILS